MSTLLNEFPAPSASKVLCVKVSVVALPTSVSVAAGNVIVTSAVLSGPLRVAEFVPLSVSSLNIILPALLDDPVSIGSVSDFCVIVCCAVVPINS